MTDAERVLTPSQTTGPMFGFALMFEGSEHAVEPGSPGAVAIEGSLFDGDGEPIAYPDGLIEVWRDEQWARCRTDEHGAFRVVVARPEPAELPGAGVEAPYLNVTIFARGLLRSVQTRVYFPDEDEANAADPVLGLVPEERRDTLIATREADGRLRFDVHLQGERETVFFDL